MMSFDIDMNREFTKLGHPCFFLHRLYFTHGNMSETSNILAFSSAVFLMWHGNKTIQMI